MRRPPPLPASAEEPEDVGGRERLRGRRVPTRGRDAASDAVPDAALTDAETQPLDGLRSAAAAGIDVQPGSSSGPAEHVDEASDSAAPAGQSLRSADVWRAARARRKALRAEIRRFTQRSRRRRMVLWGWIGAVVVLVLGSVVAAYSPLFAVQKITVAGVKTLDAASVQQALAGQVGAPLALVDASAVKAALTEFPMIESYALEARPPHELLVRIVERTPVGVIESDAGYTLVDAAGVVLSTTPERPEGQPVLKIDTGVESPAFHSAGLVIRSLPAELRATVTEVSAGSADDVSFKTSDGKTVMWGSERNSVEKALVLVELIAAAPDARTFDVSSPSVPVVG
ncbi:FtsQ-type POTRA domain-containing protein [Microbacterium sp.]|uniref:FtsQ-type POTRA domain-containing protein n=1 Tax=Microbacterium sp. TaxID=51671 RepID=UPI00281218A8|nr:FtsQ-type POTRA domain-containing protein [Microbacterium sp.]